MGYMVEFDEGATFCCVFAIEALSVTAVDASSNAEAELAVGASSAAWADSDAGASSVGALS